MALLKKLCAKYQVDLTKLQRVNFYFSKRRCYTFRELIQFDEISCIMFRMTNSWIITIQCRNFIFFPRQFLGLKSIIFKTDVTKFLLMCPHHFKESPPIVGWIFNSSTLWTSFYHHIVGKHKQFSSSLFLQVTKVTQITPWKMKQFVIICQNIRPKKT